MTGQVEMEMEAGTQHYSQMVIVHWRILCDLVDAAIGVSMASSLTAGKIFSILKLQMNYLRPIQDRGLVARTRTVCRGSNHRLNGVGGAVGEDD